MASRRRFRAFVYTVAPWAWVVSGLGITIVYTNGRIGPLRAVLGHLCTLLHCCRQPWGRRSVHKLAKMVSRRRFRAFVYTVAPWAWVVSGLGITIVYTNGRIGPLRAGLGHLCTLSGCCAVVDRRGDAGVYTDWRKWTPDAVLGHLCTLLRLARIVRATVATQECTQIGENDLPTPFWGICVHCCDSRGSFERPW